MPAACGSAAAGRGAAARAALTALALPALAKKPAPEPQGEVVVVLPATRLAWFGVTLPASSHGKRLKPVLHTLLEERLLVDPETQHIVAAPDAQAIDDIVVSEGRLGRAPSPFSLHFDHREIGETLGYIVENRHIRIALLKAAAEERRLRLYSGLGAENLVVSDAAATMTLSDGTAITAKLAVAAEGRESPLRESQEIKTVGWEYAQTGIVVTVEHERPHKGVAYEHFLPTGPFAILPMTGNRSSLVWTEKTAIAKRLIALSEEDFTAEIVRRFGAHLGAVKAAGPRWSYPLGLLHAERYAAERLALPACGRAWILLGSRKNSKRGKCPKMPQNPTRQVHALLARF